MTRWLTVWETATALDASPALVVAAAETGHIRGREIRRSVWLLDADSVAEIVARSLGEPAPVPAPIYGVDIRPEGTPKNADQNRTDDTRSRGEAAPEKHP